MSAAIAFRGWAAEAGLGMGVSMSIDSAISDVCILPFGAWNEERQYPSIKSFEENSLLGLSYVASDMGHDRGNLTRRPLPAFPFVNVL